MELEIYRRPVESPSWVFEDKDIRIFYAGQWVDFRDGKVRILRDGENEQVAEADAELRCDQCGNTETPPYDEGDSCYCGGVFRTA